VNAEIRSSWYQIGLFLGITRPKCSLLQLSLIVMFCFNCVHRVIVCSYWIKRSSLLSPPREVLRYVVFVCVSVCWGRISRKRFEIEAYGSDGPPIGNDIWRIERSCAWWRHVTRCGPAVRIVRCHVFGPGNGSPSATNVVVLVLVLGSLGLLLSDFQCTKPFSFHNRSSLNFAHRLVIISR